MEQIEERLTMTDHPFEGQAMTTHEFVIGLFNAVGALSERLTGERLNVCIIDGAGNYVHVYADTGRVWFEPITQTAAEGRTASPVALGARHCAWHTGDRS